MSFPNTQIVPCSFTNYNNNNSITTDQQNGFLQFIFVTNAEVDIAKHYLNSTGWNVDAAIHRFFDDRGDPNRITAKHKEAFNNNDKENITNTQQQREIIRRNRDHLCSVFTPPSYRFTGSLENAIKKASKENKWILINIQDLQNRGNSHCLSNISHHLNREIFKDKNLSSVIKKKCILFQWISASHKAKHVISKYHPSKIPCIVLIDPNTEIQYNFDIPDCRDKTYKMNTLKAGLAGFLYEHRPSIAPKYTKIMKNPLVIIIGISDYLEPNHPLPQVKKDIDNMKALWINKCGYKNVECAPTNIKKEQLITFTRNQAAKLQLHGNEMGIDGLILTHSGHGCCDNENGVVIISSDNEEIPLSQIQNIFATTCDILLGKPKLFYIDCCRGGMEIKENNIKQIAKGTKVVNSIYVNGLTNFYVHYATSNNYYAYTWNDELGSHLINAIYKYYGDKFDKKQCVDLINSSVIINNMINQSSKGAQTSESISDKLLYNVYIRPNK